jgi:hypothetical protein
VSVCDWDQGVYDHTPLILNTCNPAFTGNGSKFKLELSWFNHDNFRDHVIEIWNKPTKGNNSVQLWNNKLSALRRYLRGWAKHKFGIYKQAKGSLQQTIDQLHIMTETCDLSLGESLMLSQAWDQLAKLLREEEIKLYQMAKVNDVLLGDNNMKYFQMIANDKHRKK